MFYFYSYNIQNAFPKDIPIAIARLIGEIIQALHLVETDKRFFRIVALQVLALSSNFVTPSYSSDSCARGEIQQTRTGREVFQWCLEHVHRSTHRCVAFWICGKWTVTMLLIGTTCLTANAAIMLVHSTVSGTLQILTIIVTSLICVSTWEESSKVLICYILYVFDNSFSARTTGRLP